MSGAALLDELLQAFAQAVPPALSPATPAKAANRANREDWRGLQADPEVCEGLRIPANPAPEAEPSASDSQTFASLRRSPNRPESEERRGLSQISQDSQGWAGFKPSEAELAAVACTDADIARFQARRDRLLRWGWAEPEAEALAERLVKRDREADPRVTCAECKHYRPGRCGNHRRAGLWSAEIGRNLAGLLQRCAGFNERG